MRVENHDFFYYKPDHKGHGDFTDHEVFSPEKKKEFLEHYSDFCRKTYHIPEYSVKACPEAEAKELETLVGVPVSLPKVSKRINFTHMEAQLRTKNYAYSDWSFHTNRISVQGNELVFGGEAVQPSPSAEYKLDIGAVTEISLDLYFDREYQNHGMKSKFSCNNPHRLISLNDGVTELFMFTVHPNGVVSAGVTRASRYHPRLKPIGKVEWNSWQTLKIIIDGDNFTVSFDGGELQTYPVAAHECPDRMLFSSGTLHRGEWRVRPTLIKGEKGEKREFFVPLKEKKCETEALGEVKLPYSVGNIKNADKTLVLTRDFEVEGFKKAVLTLNSIDPGGRVFVDGKQVAEADNFEEFKVDVTKALGTEKKHTLTVEVDPRGAEIPCRRHSNRDPYNGWFSDEISLDLINEIEITDPRIVTLFAEEKTAKAVFSCKTSAPCKVKIYMAPSWPKKEEEILIGEAESDGAMSTEITLSDVFLWSAATPELYDIRFEAVKNDKAVDDTVVETGFRTIDQRNGGIYVNGKKTMLNGALTMQYLPPHDECSTTHICPREWQIIWQYLMLKRMQANTLRLHILGFGTNEARFARLADRLGVMLLWTTRYIDALEQVEWEGEWLQRDGYLRQITLRQNHPSIVMWEGSNEFMPDLEEIDRAHREFVPAVKSVDTSRLLSPLSHHYYAGDRFAIPGCNYYSTDGLSDVFGNSVNATPEWTDPLVVRAAHPYVYSLGVGQDWTMFRLQDWPEQEKLLSSRERAYIATEYAIIGRQDPRTKEAKEIYFNPTSYEVPNESVLGFELTPDDWRLSQAYQALGTSYVVRRYRAMDIDGLMWCALFGGGNDGGYMKPLIDMYGYAKYAWYVMQENLKKVTCVNDTTDVMRGEDFTVKPVLFAEPGEVYSVTVAVTDEKGNPIDIMTYGDVEVENDITRLPEWKPSIPTEGYYAVKTIVLKTF